MREMYAVNRNPTLKDLRMFGLVMLIGFWAIGVLLWLVPWLSTGAPETLSWMSWSGGARQVTAVVLFGIGPALCVLSFSLPRPARIVYVGWMTAAMAIGVVMSTILLTLLFIFLLPPFSLVVRLGDPLRRKMTRGGSYWEDCKPYEATLERMKRPF